MNFINDEIVFASLLGSKISKSLPNFRLVQNELSKHVLPPIPFIPEDKTREVEPVRSTPINSVSTATPPNIEKQFFPLTFRRPVPGESWYTFPYEPIINVSGKNIIVKRRPAKAEKFIGSIKERWSQDDYQITITGAIIGEIRTGSPGEVFPREDFERLRDYCTSPEGIEVRCELLQLLGINNLVVDDFRFPFTKGGNVQAYEISASSDFSSDFLLEIED